MLIRDYHIILHTCGFPIVEIEDVTVGIESHA